MKNGVIIPNYTAGLGNSSGTFCPAAGKHLDSKIKTMKEVDRK